MNAITLPVEPPAGRHWCDISRNFSFCVGSDTTVYMLVIRSTKKVGDLVAGDIVLGTPNERKVTDPLE